MNIVSRYTFDYNGTKAFPMCHQASFHLKFARKYPLLALKLSENRVVFKTGSVKKKEKKRRCGIIPDKNYTNVVCALNSMSPTFKHWKMFIVTMQNGWNNRISDGCVCAQIRRGLGMHLVTYSNHDTVLFLLIVPIKGQFV